MVGTGTGGYTIDVQISNEDDSEVVEKVLAVGTAQAGQPLAPIAPIDCLYSTMSLNYSVEGQGIRLLAPPWATNIVVESTRALAPASWMEVTQTISPSDGVLITNLPSGSQFFRLRTK